MKGRELKVPVEVYSRVVGYFRPVDQWNKGKQSEFKERREYEARDIHDFLEIEEKILQGVAQ